jgi:hypothetical protein
VRRPFLWLSPLPLVLWALGLRYLAHLEGWGAWGAAAPVLLPVLALSAVLGGWGLVLLWRARRRGEPLGRLALATLTASTVAVYHGVRGVV